ncbi:MAG: sulfatase-like hydrolase/transferase [Bacteroidales bacterium]|nr:sulfatase-like hydrolase/transferase [Bacteroidales bacterium]
MKSPASLFLGSIILAGACSTAQEKPNIILIMADDMGWGDTGYNGNDIILTPHLDQMADDGVRFDRFYSASAVSSPTRASVLTGRNPFRTGVFTANQGILRPEEVTIPELLKEEGYETGHFGKWHLGTLTYSERDANRGKPGNTKEYNPPALHGFDVAFSTESKVPTWDPMKKRKGGGKRSGNYLLPEEEFEHYGTYYWDIDGNKITDNLEGDDSRVIMDRVLPFIDKSVENKNPFFAVVWFHTPHKPYIAGPEYHEIYKEHSLDVINYAGSITAMDKQIGRLREFLKEKGADENTMIWFCSDNGPENRTPGSTAGLRDRKRSLHEGGIRVPGVMVWPAKIKEPFVSESPAFTSDYLPTIAEVLNIDDSLITNELDGTSLLPVLSGEKNDRASYMGFSIGNQLVWMNSQQKLYSSGPELEIFDIQNDREEKNNIIDGNPDLKKEMIEALEDWQESCKKSFDGEEYGTKSVEKLNQRWRSIKIEDE